MSGYSVTNYNPYNVNNNFAFKGVTTDTTSQIKNVPKLTQQPDTVSFSTKNKKESLSNGAKWGIGALALAGVATLAYVLSKGKVGSKQTQQIVKQVEFKPAKTIEEAKKFAKDKLGVTITDSTGKFEDVECVNFINEWLTNTHNNPKFGPNSYPKIVCNSKTGVMSMLDDNFVKDGIDYGRIMTINLDFFKNFKTRAIDKYMPQLDILTKNAEGKYVIVKSEYDCPYTRRIVKYANAKELSFKDKMQCWSDLKTFESWQDRNLENISENSLWRTINHEQGHFLHGNNCSDYKLMKKVKEFDDEPVSAITQEFVNNNDIQNSARKVSRYATTSPAEFVAEVFAGLKDGKVYDNDVMALYKKYGGPAIS